MPTTVAGFVPDGPIYMSLVKASSNGDTIERWASDSVNCERGRWTVTWAASTDRARAAVFDGQVLPGSPLPSSQLTEVVISKSGGMRGNYCQQPVFFSVTASVLTAVTVKYRFWIRDQPAPVGSMSHRTAH